MSEDIETTFFRGTSFVHIYDLRTHASLEEAEQHKDLHEKILKALQGSSELNVSVRQIPSAETLHEFEKDEPTYKSFVRYSVGLK